MAKPVMILGTASGVGKSTIATGLCRLLARRGLAVAPFKAQNMSNAAHVCADGSQMARSQAIAAYACGIEPHPDMNPVLLKYARGRMEAIVNGATCGWMDSAAYREKKRDLWPHILQPYSRLAAQYDAIVLEGAGSPVELNLKAGDIANMAMAEKAAAPVLLVADIDRGGVYASVYGTLSLLAPEEHERVKGVIINRVKGNAAAFADVKEALERLIRIPVLGLMPYIRLEIEDEDGLIDPLTGIKPAQTLDAMLSEFERLADAMEEHIDIARILTIMELKEVR